MACTPFPAPDQDLFIDVDEGIWSQANETKDTRSVTHSGNTVVATGPNGSTNVSVGGSGTIHHKFFGGGNFLAIYTADATSGPCTFAMDIVDFTANPTKVQNVMFISGDAFHPPWVQYAKGSGSLCLIGCPTSSGTQVGGLGIFRSDTGESVCPGPPPFTPTLEISGKVVGTTCQIMHGGTIIAGPCPFPAGKLQVTPTNPTFTTVKIGGCPQPASTKQFTLKNNGTDCLTVSSIANSGPFSVTSTSVPLPTTLAKNEFFTATVTFSPIAAGSFNNTNLTVTRSPANGDDKLVCSGQAVLASTAISVTPSTVDFTTVLIGTTAGPKTVTITNTGDIPINVSVSGSPGPLFAWTGKSAMLDCGANMKIDTITFTPVSDEVPEQTTMTVVCAQTGNKTVTIKGTGCLPNPEIVKDPASGLDFGNVRQGYRMPRFITIKNIGDDLLTFNAHIDGPDKALFGLMKPSQSITDVVVSSNPQSYSVAPTFHCGGGPTGDGAEEVVVVFFANAAPNTTATATLTVDNHNDPTAAASFTYNLTAKVIDANKVDVVAVFDTSGSMNDAVPGGGTKMLSAMEGGKLLTQLIPPDLQNRVAATRFASDASTFLPIDVVTAGNQQSKADAIANPPLTPNGWTAIAAGAMTGQKEFATAHPGGTPANLTKAMIVLTDGMDNTAFKNPDDGQYYTILGGSAWNETHSATVSTNPYAPPPDVKVYAIGLGTGQDIDMAQLSALSSGAGGYFGVVDPTQPAVTYQLMKFYTQIYMDLVDTSVIQDPKYSIAPGQTHKFDFPVLRGDVSGTVVIYDIGGWRLPFWLETPKGEIIDAGFVPPGFQLRSGFTNSTRFLDFVLPWGDPDRYAGTWKLIVRHEGRMCRGRPVKGKKTGFVPEECRETKASLEYGFAIGVGSNFRLNAYVSPQPLKVGDPILLTGVPTEAGLPVKGCTVTVTAVAPNGQTWTGIVLRDDGLHQDGDKDDGEYALPFTHTAMPGSYTFTFRATGVTRDGEPVMREAVRSKYVDGWKRQPPDDHPCHRLEVSVEKLRELLEALVKRQTPNPPH